MKKTKMTRNCGLAFALAAVMGLGFLSGCAQSSNTKTAKLAYPNWAEGIAYTHLAMVVLQDKMDYDVDITSADVGPAYTAVSQGSEDAFMECWPGLHKSYLEKFEGKLVDLGEVYEGTEMGLAVPAYVTIDTISELNEHAEKFGGRITGIDAGAGIMITTEEEVIPMYNLDMELLSSSGPAMTAALQDAVDNEEWIVVTAWKPHWMFARWDLKFLEQDEDKVVWEPGVINIMGREDLREEKPELAQFLANMKLSDPQLADLMLKVNESDDDVEAVARAWMEANPEVIEAWIPETAAM